jgi:RNA polymerase sigma-70 factor, ECF subfamily
MAHPPKNDNDVERNREAFVQLIAAEQFRLIHYISILLGDPQASRDVLQETNLVLWRKAAEYDFGRSFSAWARRIAYWQVKAHVRDRSRDRHTFSEEFMENLADYAEETDSIRESDEADSMIALRHCLRELSESNRELLQLRYEEGTSIASLAVMAGAKQSAIKVRLLRIRRALMRCMERRLAITGSGNS